jgi:hypothetical protein
LEHVLQLVRRSRGVADLRAPATVEVEEHHKLAVKDKTRDRNKRLYLGVQAIGRERLPRVVPGGSSPDNTELAFS